MQCSGRNSCSSNEGSGNAVLVIVAMIVVLNVLFNSVQVSSVNLNGEIHLRHQK